MMMNLFFHGERSCPTASDYIHQKMFGIGSKDKFFFLWAQSTYWTGMFWIAKQFL